MIRWLHILLIVLAGLARGHELRPSYLGITESAPDTYEVVWKVPARGEMRLSLDVAFDAATRIVLPPSDHLIASSHVRRWTIHRPGGLDGSTVRIDGLGQTLTDVLVRIAHLDGRTASFRIAPEKPEFTVDADPGWLAHARTHFVIGIEHILLGIDHLLFVLALVVLVKGTRRLIGTVTAFTVAHSITLAAATLGFVHVPGPPVEAVIALSIVFVAAEILRDRRGRRGLSERAPWLVAGSFGLLHGLGFAGALSEVGLPQQAIPLALLFFNLGVEAGQLAFVAFALGFIALLRRLRLPAWAPLAPPYAIGSLAMFWVIERTACVW